MYLKTQLFQKENTDLNWMSKRFLVRLLGVARLKRRLVVGLGRSVSNFQMTCEIRK